MTKSIRVSRKAPHINNEPPKTVRASDLRIADAIGTLQAHERGRNVLAQFKTFASSRDVQGLDMTGQAALITLIKELTFGSRRDFIKTLPSAVNFSTETAIEFGYKACEKGWNIQETFENYKQL